MSEILDIDRLARGSAIDAPLVIKDKQGVRPYRDGNFFTLELGNRTGEIRAKYWGGSSEVQDLHDKLSVGDVVRVRGTSSSKISLTACLK